jgi:hypothetical protein
LALVAATLSLAGCQAPSQGDVETPLPVHSSSLSMPALLEGKFVMVAPPAGWTLSRVVLAGEDRSGSSAALLGLVVETDATATAHVLVATLVDRTTARPVGAYFIAVPPNTTYPLSRFISHLGGDLSNLHDEFAVLLRAENGSATIHGGLVPPEAWEDSPRPVWSVYNRTVIPTRAEATGDHLAAGTYWHFSDTNGVSVTLQAGHLTSDKSVLHDDGQVIVGSSAIYEGEIRAASKGIVAAEFTSARQPGALRWNLALETPEPLSSSGAYAYGWFQPVDIGIAVASTAPIVNAPPARLQAHVDGASRLAIHAEEHYSFERPPQVNPLDPQDRGQATWTTWGYSDVDFEQLFGWPMDLFPHQSDSDELPGPSRA